MGGVGCLKTRVSSRDRGLGRPGPRAVGECAGLESPRARTQRRPPIPDRVGPLRVLARRPDEYTREERERVFYLSPGDTFRLGVKEADPNRAAGMR